ncbi:FAD-dependent oxidoreductase [Mesorhizobium sp.]|uniref:NAD(P)/FAD-dependent oxidoreductase n=1 Tax=Mesorhizobium sp. TaxID=1871066 RepID=UPI000FEA8591|nr:FAD-dependent oxidoreductase [Mesorhizobium sp.]RWI16588.1 MAG: ferredoxin reductase [Mesorhizobium sp.]RWN07657.1 MAG: ferredoxin reductase [Mesorhizobium sp.]RWN12424.1 MAG: ferredoxin reductase [Mesorhizobium sp.]TIQ97703.1 MAG: ferredoxin reductase [Mesorhizobium sp.]
MSSEGAIVIIGAGEAGTAAAIAVRQRGWPGRVVLVGNETLLPYERPPLSKAILIDESNVEPRLIVTPERLDALGIEYLHGREVLLIDRAVDMIMLSDGARIPYHRALLTTGARPRELTIPIAEGSKVATLRTYDDAMGIRQVVGSGCDVVVIGGGFIGLEVAASAVSRGASVTVIEAGPRLLTRSVPSPMADLIRAKHERSGVRIETGAIVERIDISEGRSSVVLSDGRTRSADLVVVGVGAVPNVELAQAAGLAIDNGVLLDETLATSDPHIFAAGDCCSFPHRLYGKRIRLEAWRNAQRQGAAAAANMLGENLPYQEVPWFWSDQYDETLQIAGLCDEGQIPIARDLGDKGLLFYYLAKDGRLVAACGFGSLGVIAKEIRYAEMMIARRLAPEGKALADPAVNLRSLLA